MRARFSSLVLVTLGLGASACRDARQTEVVVEISGESLSARPRELAFRWLTAAGAIVQERRSAVATESTLLGRFRITIDDELAGDRIAVVHAFAADGGAEIGIGATRVTPTAGHTRTIGLPLYASLLDLDGDGIPDAVQDPCAQKAPRPCGADAGAPGTDAGDAALRDDDAARPADAGDTDARPRDAAPPEDAKAAIDGPAPRDTEGPVTADARPPVDVATSTADAGAAVVDAATGPPSTNTSALAPVFLCIAALPEGGYASAFRVRNTLAVDVLAPAGAVGNSFAPAPADRHQPSSFPPGSGPPIVIVHAESPLTWQLGGKTATAGAAGAQCPLVATPTGRALLFADGTQASVP